jgi:quercetin dioxygenase-like cupin family protein
MRPGTSRFSVAGERSSVTRVITAAEAVFDGTMHKHDHEQWLVMLKGRVELADDGARYWVEEGDVVIFRRHTFHGALAVGENGAEYLEIFAPARIDQLTGFVGSSPLEWS